MSRALAARCQVKLLHYPPWKSFGHKPGEERKHLMIVESKHPWNWNWNPGDVGEAQQCTNAVQNGPFVVAQQEH
jgi:hypothetical protein